MTEKAGGSWTSRQLTFEFPRPDPNARPLIETAPYAAALLSLARWRDWPGGQLALTGAPQSGRTRLLRDWALEAGAAMTTGADLASASIVDISNLSVHALAVDDADPPQHILRNSVISHRDGGVGLLAALNLCRERGAVILLAGGHSPGQWYDDPPDLRSRLQAMPVVAIGEPDEETLAARLVAECAERFVSLPRDVASYICERMERSYSAIGKAADMLERSGFRRFTRAAARDVLASLEGTPEGFGGQEE